MSLKELRRRIASVKSTQKITSAMKMVASAKLRRLQERVLFGNNFLKSLHNIGCSLGKSQHDAETLNIWRSPNGKHDLIIIFGAENGLCGGFHSHQMRQINNVIDENPDAKLLVFGTKAADSLKAHKNKILPMNLDLKHPKMQNFFNIAKELELLKTKKEIGRVQVIGSAFKNILSQKPYNKVLCPFKFTDHSTRSPRPVGSRDNSPVESSSLRAPGERGNPYPADTSIFEPSIDVFLPYFFTQYLAVSLHQCWLETLAGEMASRMTAMDNATRNAKDMISDLSLVYNRTRQAKITTELTEIIAGSQGA